jgi:hypothetical protein
MRATATVLVRGVATAAPGTAIGAGVCAFLGPPGWLACGAAAGTALWITTDKVMIELDEAIHRDEFEREVKNMIDELKKEVKERIKQSFADFLAPAANDYMDCLKSITPRDAAKGSCQFKRAERQ